MGGKFVDLTGRRYGLLTVLGLDGKRCERTRWRCRCDCGNETSPMQFALKQGATSTCGNKRLHRKGVPLPANRTHGLTGTREHKAWIGMHSNCADIQVHGRHGLKVDKRWDDFAAFLTDMGPCPRGMELMRVDALSDFEPANCVWACRNERANNHRANRMVLDEGRVETVAEYAKRVGLKYATAYYQKVVAGCAPTREEVDRLTPAKLISKDAD